MGNIFSTAQARKETSFRPIIGVVMCENSIDENPALTVHEKYLDAIFNANALPVCLPHELASRSEEHTSELQSHRDLHSFPTRRSSDLELYRRESGTHGA